MTDRPKRFANQGAVRGPWRNYLDSLAQYRPDLHRYCRRLTGNVWDGEDLMQDTLVRVFSMLGKIDANLENPRAYLIRTATNLWIEGTIHLAHSARANLRADFVTAKFGAGGQGHFLNSVEFKTMVCASRRRIRLAA